MERLVCILIGYLCGLFQTGYLYGRLNHIDIRKHGSGNAGTTNALRTLGIKAGVITFLGDCLKTIAAVWIAKTVFGPAHPDTSALLGMYAGVGAVLGHNFPFFLKFEGGKGIAATAGIIVSLNSGLLTLAAFLSFILLVAATRYVSLGSLVLVTEFMAGMVILGQMGRFGMSQPLLYEMYALGAALTFMAYYRHKANIVRLLHGTENKLGSKK